MLLRGQEVKDPKAWQIRADAVQKALENPCLKVYQGPVFRGCDELPPDVQESLVVGGTFIDKAFLSTSKKETGAFITPATCFFFRIEGKTGLDVSMYSRKKEEEEILFRAGAKFHVTKVVRDVQVQVREGQQVTVMWVEMEEMM